jgi:hypothetical protein
VQVVELEEQPVVAVDDEQVAIATGVGGTGIAAFEPLRLRLCLLGNRVAGWPAGSSGIALFGVVEIDRHERLVSRHGGIGDAVDLRRLLGVTAEVGVHPPLEPHELEERRARGVDRRLRNVDVPPVVGRQQRERSREGAALRRALGERRAPGGEEEERECRAARRKRPRVPPVRERWHSSSPWCRSRSRR